MIYSINYKVRTSFGRVGGPQIIMLVSTIWNILCQVAIVIKWYEIMIQCNLVALSVFLFNVLLLLKPQFRRDCNIPAVSGVFQASGLPPAIPNSDTNLSYAFRIRGSL